MSSSPICTLTRQEIFELHKLDVVRLADGAICQNLLADRSVCGHPLSAHREQQGKYILLLSIVYILNFVLYICFGNYLYLVLLNSHHDLFIYLFYI
jgi:hypothetical protein